MIKAVEDARLALRQAKEALGEATRLAYPVGSQVRVLLGGHEVVVEVVSHSTAWWSSAGKMRGVNIYSGKTREFTDQDVVDIIRVGPK